jgi:hypothetical protein
VINARQFVSTATAALVRLPDALAATAVKYDFIVMGGRVSDPSRKFDAGKDRMVQFLLKPLTVTSAL